MILTRLRPVRFYTALFFEVGTTPRIVFVTNEQMFFSVVLSCLSRVLKLH